MTPPDTQKRPVTSERSARRALVIQLTIEFAVLVLVTVLCLVLQPQDGAAVSSNEGLARMLQQQYTIFSIGVGLASAILVHAVQSRIHAVGLEVTIAATRRDTQAILNAQPEAQIMSDLLQKFRSTHPLDLYHGWARGLSEGYLTVFDMADVYETGTQMVESHKRGDGDLISTVVPSDESVHRESDFPEFRDYLLAQQRAAAKREFVVYRFYLMNEAGLINAQDPQTPWGRHLRTIAAQAAKHRDHYRIFVVDPAQVQVKNPDDFNMVIFGDRCISFGRRDRVGENIIGAEYWTRPRAEAAYGAKIRKVQDWVEKVSADPAKGAPGIQPLSAFLAEAKAAAPADKG